MKQSRFTTEQIIAILQELAAVALVASWWPTWRAVRLDPTLAIRTE